MPDRSITVRLRAVVSDYTRAMGEAKRSTEQFGGQVSKLGRENAQDLTTVGLAAAGAGVAIAGGLGLAAKAAIDWESAFAGVRKTVDASEREFAALEQGLRSLATEIPVSQAELAGIAEAAGQLGISTDNILEFTKTMAELGVTTNLTSEEAATSLARFANITQLPQTEIRRLGSTIVALGNNMATTEREITEFGLRLAGAGAQIGLTEADILGFGAALSSVGVDAEAGGTAMSRVFVSIDQAVRQGGPKLEQFARTAGMTADEFAAAYRDNAAGAIVSFVEGLGDIGRAGGDVFSVLEALELQDIRVRDALLRTAGAGDELRRALGLANDEWGISLALTAEAEKRFQTIESELQKTWNALTELGIALLEGVLPALRPVLGAVRDAAKWFAGLPEPVRTTAVALAAAGSGMLVVAGTAAIVLPRIVALIDAWRRLRTAIIGAQLAGGAGAAARTVGGLGSFTLTSGAGLGVAGTAAAVGGIGAIATGGALLEAQLRQMGGSLGGPIAFAMDLGLLTARLFQTEDAADEAADTYVDAAARMGQARFGQNADEVDLLADALGISREAAEQLIGPTEDLGTALADQRAQAALLAAEYRDNLKRAILGFVDFFTEVPDMIEPAWDEFEENFDQRADAQRMFFENLAALQAAGMDNLAAMLEGKGIEYADVVAGLAADTDRAWEWERRLEDQQRLAEIYALAIAHGLELGADDLIRTATDVAQSAFLAMEQAFTSRPIVPNIMSPGQAAVSGATTPGGQAVQRQHGGPYIAGMPLIVGEGGQPELMFPSTSGRVYTKAQAAHLFGGSAGQHTTYRGGDIHINLEQTEPHIDAQRVAAMSEVLRRVEAL